MTKLEDNKEKYLKICNETIRREGIADLINWLQNSDFFTAPASTKFHGNYAGGLCEHSLNVYEILCGLCSAYAPGAYTNEEIAISALFHDLCKVNFYKQETKNVKDENGNWIKKQVWTIDEKFPGGDHADKSLVIIQNYIKLHPDEILAIRAHMGGFDTTVRGGSFIIGNIFTKSKLAVLLHSADLIASNIFEVKV